jgi:hypothetical protein
MSSEEQDGYEGHRTPFRRPLNPPDPRKRPATVNTAKIHVKKRPSDFKRATEKILPLARGDDRSGSRSGLAATSARRPLFPQ